ncbi:proteasome assembly chaperone 4 [Diachasma alloeum]|uniref:proteasome assembly chaperone 4 n=1 Tax=Diachasma alloeum TaxID=454923 RepID=UPI0007382157|nr:proteasome assembly chaperone 4 [Diachasma alloeum]
MARNEAPATLPSDYYLMKMLSPEKADVDVELLESNFMFYDFTADVGEVSYTCQIMKMEESFYVYVGKAGDESMNDLTYSFLSAYDNLPVATRLLGAVGNPLSAPLASKLTKLSGKSVYVSFNLDIHRRMMPCIEKRIAEEFKTHAMAS